MPNHTALITVNLASKRFGNNRVLQQVSISLYSGQTTLVLGPNGSGKSTLLKIMAGLCRPDSGEIQTSATISFCGHDTFLYSDFSIKENIDFFARLYGQTNQVNTALKYWELSDSQHTRLDKLSRGQQHKAALCRAFLQPAKIYALDEPSNALDNQALEKLYLKIEEVRSSGAAIIIATHDITRLSPYAQRALVLSAGALQIDEQLGIGGASSKAFDFYRGQNK